MTVFVLYFYNYAISPSLELFPILCPELFSGLLHASNPNSFCVFSKVIFEIVRDIDKLVVLWEHLIIRNYLRDLKQSSGHSYLWEMTLSKL